MTHKQKHTIKLRAKHRAEWFFRTHNSIAALRERMKK